MTVTLETEVVDTQITKIFDFRGANIEEVRRVLSRNSEDGMFLCVDGGKLERFENSGQQLIIDGSIYYDGKIGLMCDDYFQFLVSTPRRRKIKLHALCVGVVYSKEGFTSVQIKYSELKGFIVVHSMGDIERYIFK
jgi:hypothetical protein